MNSIEIGKHWPKILEALNSGKKSNRFFSIATVNSDGTPHVTPIGHAFFNDNMTGYYFDQFSAAMPRNFESNKNICLMSVNSSTLFWLKSLYIGKFSAPPAIRLMGTVGERRDANQKELERLHQSISVTSRLRGHKLLWGNLTKVRDMQFSAFSPAKYPIMCDELW
ncbi:MAG: pyridoxamine 5'-phosphate oxidase family protein [Leucothrix sp.]